MTEADETVTVDIDTANEYNIKMGKNLPNHTMTQAGRGTFIRQMESHVPTFRTRQEAYRYCAHILRLAEALPDEEGAEEHTFQAVLDAVLEA